MRFFLLVFIIVPILEMFILIRVGSIIGALPTIALVVLTATVGVWLLKREGLATLTRLQGKLAEGEIPGKELLEGVMLIIGGALLLTPGFVTDAVGFVCLLPWLRQPVAIWLLQHTQFNFIQGGFQMGAGGPFGRQGPGFDPRNFQGRTFFGEAFEDQTTRDAPQGTNTINHGQSSVADSPRTINGEFDDINPPHDQKP
jgi:UPF0716 protein FxsA